jgi:sugar phosphate isomerase/epimerase
MKIGFISHELDERTFAFAAASGFAAIEWAGFAHGIAASEVITLVQRYRRERGIDLVALGTAVNPLHPDPTERDKARAYLDELVSLCPRLGSRYVSNVSGWDPGQDLVANLRLLSEYYRPLAARARQHGVAIVFENCPHGYPFPGGQNLAVTPELWRQVFEAIAEENVGLEFDPSHLAWQGIDCMAACRESIP